MPASAFFNCPYCDHLIRHGAVVCRHCREDLPQGHHRAHHLTADEAPAGNESTAHTAQENSLERKVPRHEHPVERAACPHCGSSIYPEASICRHCREEVVGPADSRRSATNAHVGVGTIRVSRPYTLWGNHRKWTLFIEAEPAKALRPGDVVVLQVPVGRHSVRVEAGRIRPASVDIDLKPSTIVTVTLTETVWKWSNSVLAKVQQRRLLPVAMGARGEDAASDEIRRRLLAASEQYPMILKELTCPVCIYTGPLRARQNPGPAVLGCLGTSALVWVALAAFLYVAEKNYVEVSFDSRQVLYGLPVAAILGAFILGLLAPTILYCPRCDTESRLG